MTRTVNLFDMLSPADYRYRVKDLVPFLSEEAFVRYKAFVEGGLAVVQARRGLIDDNVAAEIREAALQVTAEEVYNEEDRIGHDVLAQKNVTVTKVSEPAKSAVHRPATSFDKVETANAARYRDAFTKVIIPDMVELEKAWISGARDYKDTLQIGRTHLQHAEPITYGFYLAVLAHRFGDRILKVRYAVDGLRGKFSGSVGAYNASSLFFDDPEEFEREVTAELGVLPAEISTQIAPPEPLVDLLHCVISAYGVIANWAEDMRDLQRPEIAEIGHPRAGIDQSTSSIMPHKHNPVGLENVSGLFSAVMPFMVTAYINQISDHERDLRNSAPMRYAPAIFDQFDYVVRRAARIAKKLKPHEHNMRRNFDMSADKIISEPLQITLSAYGHPDAHTYVQGLTEQSYQKGVPLRELVFSDQALKPYFVKFTPRQMDVINDPSKYLGVASQKAQKVADMWEQRLRETNMW